MELQRTRMFILVALLVVGFALFNQWQTEHPATPKQETRTTANTASTNDSEIPNIATTTNSATLPNFGGTNTASVDLIDVTTDVLKIKIDPVGGDIVRAELLKYPESLHSEQGFILFYSRRTY